MLFLPQGLEFAAEEAGRWAKSLFCVKSGDGRWDMEDKTEGEGTMNLYMESEQEKDRK